MTEIVRLEDFFSINALHETLKKYIKFNTAIGIDKMTYQSFLNQNDEQIRIINKGVLNGTYKFTPYREHLIIKNRDSVPRLISIPTIRDKLVLKSLHIVLKDIYKNIEQKLPQAHIQEIKSSLKDYDYFIKLDISNFFGGIKHGILFNELAKKIEDDVVINLIKKSITTLTVSNDNKRDDIITQGVPQGLSISNILANIYIGGLDEKLHEKANIKYIRYVDDILILCKETDFSKVYREIKYEIEGIYNLNLNEKKYKHGLIKDGFDFLGYRIEQLKENRVGLTVREDNKRRHEDSIVKIFTNYKFNKDKIKPEQFIFKLNNKITGSISEKVEGNSTREFKYGWLFYYSQMDDTGFLYHLDWLIKKLLKEFQFNHINPQDIKSYFTTYYEIKYNIKNTKYIHRPDVLTHKEQKELLIKVFNIHSSKLRDSQEIEKLYYKFVYKPIRDYEKDIQKLLS
ncbi:reverse transcriptase domain-containing protein [Bacillus mycoides]|uniref:reverse transcriptase domain-containing protein n=1 Tax=Bacillus mycoides TaxID=1405 RepID=UPI000BF13075|nr:reverse transcriptase domain-containing protein [Bacillus mycoides]PEK86905.1 hypothetical protein CN600_28775 [Bacillus mycoides]